MNESKSKVQERYHNFLASCKKNGFLTPSIVDTLRAAFDDYSESAKGFYPEETLLARFKELTRLVEKELRSPFTFLPHHQKVIAPYDYEAFGKDFVRPLIDEKRSTIFGTSALSLMEEQLKKKENVLLFANHQTELDAQILPVLIEKSHPWLAKNITFVAGERVLKDPMAIPFSMGCSLFCIYSRKYIATPPEKKTEKQEHNKKTLRLLGKALDQGGLCVYVAPSGGRDRKLQKNAVSLAPFDEKSISLLHLIGMSSAKTTHFYPLSLKTYALAPPPEDPQLAIGEKRELKRVPIGVYFGEEMDLSKPLSKKTLSKKEQRCLLKEMIYSCVLDGYQQL
ncbi:MAG: 1-acyl-sn-glycerol-3-phosphate acyltransferase [Chlamydiota bacterium]